MAADAYKNFAYTTVATAPSPASSGTSLVVAAGTGTVFPAVPFNAVVWPASSQPTNANAEIVRVTARATDTLTITRTQESTSARSIVVGDQIAAALTAKLVTDLAPLPANELTYVEFTANVSVTATTEATANTAVTAGAVSFDGATVVIVEFFAAYGQPQATTGAGLHFVLYDGASSIGLLASVGTPASSTELLPVRAARRLTPSNASHTYSVRAYTSSGTATVGAGVGGAGNYVPGFIRITRV